MKKGKLKKHQDRNKEIAQEYENLRRVGYTPNKAIEILHQRYPHLSESTLVDISTRLKYR